MQLADCRRNNDSSFPSTSTHVTTAPSYRKSLCSVAEPSAGFIPSTGTHCLHKSDNKVYRLPNIQPKCDIVLTDTFPLMMQAGTNDLQKERYNDLIENSSADTNSQLSAADPICIFPYRFLTDNSKPYPSHSSKSIFTQLCNPYFILTPSYGSTPKILKQNQSFPSETHSSDESLIPTSSENLMNTAFPYSTQSFSHPVSSSLITHGLTDPEIQSTDQIDLTLKDSLALKDNILCAFSHTTELHVQSNKSIFSDLPQKPFSYKGQSKVVRLLSTSEEGRSLASHPVITRCRPLTLKSSGINRGISSKKKIKMTNSNGSKAGVGIKETSIEATCRRSQYKDLRDSGIIAYVDRKDIGSKIHGDVQENDILTNMRQSSIMYQTFQRWATKNYGDTGKTKTVTHNKYRRIVRILTGEEQFTAENSKFRFWVKAKGFRLSSEEGEVEYRPKTLLVPSKHTSEELDVSHKTFKRVAVVEDFFDIIYNVHVEMDGRVGKHAGQKRTYRAIAETYSFLPREAVTRFLMSCTDCQKRMQLSLESNNNSTSADDRTDQQDDSVSLDPPNVMEYPVPTTHTYITQAGESKKTLPYSFSVQDEDSVSSCSAMSREASPSVREAKVCGEHNEDRYSPVVLKNKNRNNNNNKTESKFETPPDMTTARRISPQPMETETRATDSSPDDVPSRKTSPVPGKITEVKSHPERKRRASSESGDSAMTKTSEGKDDDDEDDNDDDEKILVGQNIDPERLKAFNMFVRLFVDENLDRMVPISKQPKDKIQAILEACDRQFPEFHERSRKRIRTYLKSCRRMRRSKEHNGWEPLRPTPPHLTSAAAESLLATACENESQNAKRMRLGLEPLPASAMVSHSTIVTSQTPPSTQPSSQPHPPAAVTQTPSQPSNLSSSRSINCSVPTATDFLRNQPPPPTFRGAPEFTPSFFTNGHGTTLFRPGFPSYQHPAHHHPTMLPHAPITANATANGEFGPTDLSMKKSSNKGQLSPSEVTAIKQLIAGYRESAAFLYRSADELEQLLLQQN